jgi:hypothetical protein
MHSRTNSCNTANRAVCCTDRAWWTIPARLEQVTVGQRALPIFFPFYFLIQHCEITDHSSVPQLALPGQTALVGTLQLFPPFSHYREKSFPKTPVFPTLGKGSKQARRVLQHMYSAPPSVLRVSITNQMVTLATTIEYRIRYNQVSSGHSALTALKLIKF